MEETDRSTSSRAHSHTPISVMHYGRRQKTTDLCDAINNVEKQ